MTTASLGRSVASPSGGARRFLAEARAASALLMNVALGSLGLLAAALALSFADPRTLGGVSVWAKPAKFAASVVFMAPMLAFAMSQMAPVSKGLRRAARIFAIAFIIELALITMQAARGVPSHFNFTSAFDALVFQVMAGAIVTFWLTQIWLTQRAFRHRFADPARGWGLRMGLLIATLGAGTAFAMPSNTTAAQQRALARGEPTMVGAHAVGVEDGGPGLPITRWSREGGDLRVAHFLVCTPCRFCRCWASSSVAVARTPRAGCGQGGWWPPWAWATRASS